MTISNTEPAEVRRIWPATNRGLDDGSITPSQSEFFPAGGSHAFNNENMHSPSLTTQLERQRRRQRRALAACSSTIALPLMPRWFERSLAAAVAATALASIIATAITSV